MKKIILSLCLVLFVSSAYAGSCPMMAKNIDDKIKKLKSLETKVWMHINLVIMLNLKNF